MKDIRIVRDRSAFEIFLGLSQAIGFLVVTVDRWPYIISGGPIGLLYLLLLLSLILAGLYLGRMGIGHFQMTQNSETKLADFKSAMSSQGYPNFMTIIVYNDEWQWATPEDKKLRYRYYDQNHTFKPNYQTDITLPYNTRFVLVADNLNQAILAYDNLKESWLLFSK